jgi:hypothetical protein
VKSLFLLALIAAATPKPSDDTEALIKQGVELRRRGKDTEALEVFRRAYDKSKAPKAQAQVALAQQALGLWVEAETNLESALATKDKWIKEKRSTLEKALDQIKQRLGTLEIAGGVPGAKVVVNGEPAGELPLERPLRVVAGTVSLEVTHPLHWPLTRSIVVPAGGLARETVKLAPRPTASNEPGDEPKEAPPPVASARPPEPPPSAASPTIATTAVREEPSGAGPWPWVALGVGAAGIATGVVGLVLREGHASKWNGSECLPASGVTREEACGDERRAAESAQTIATIGFVAGGAGLAASALLMLIAPSDEEEAVAIGIDPRGIWVKGHY